MNILALRQSRLWLAIALGCIIGSLQVTIGNDSVVLVVILLIACFTLIPKQWLAILLLLDITIQNTVVPYALKVGVLSNSGSFLLLTFPEVIVLVVILRTLFLKLSSKLAFELSRVEKVAVFFVVICSVYYLYPNHVGMLGKLNQYRQLITPVAFFIAGAWIQKFELKTVKSTFMMMRLAIWFSFVAAILGYMFTYIGGAPLWRWMGIGYYWINIKLIPSQSIVGGLPGNFFRGYGTLHPQLRFIGPYGDPLSTGYALMLGLFLLFVVRLKNIPRLILSVVFIIAIYKTDTRAAFLATLLFFLLVILDRYFSGNQRKVLAVTVAIMVMGLVSFARFSGIYYSVMGDQASTQGHLLALKTDLSILPHFWGYGVGVGGVSVLLPDHSGENTLFQIYSQVGVVGTIAFVAFVVVLFQELVQKNHLGKILSFALLSYAITGMFSTEILTDTASGAFWVVAGIVSSFLPKEDNLEQSRDNGRTIDKRLGTVASSSIEES